MASRHPRDMRARIWRAILCASDQEIRDGLDFYPGAHGLCKLFALMFARDLPHLTVEHVAGIYAALSPMNGWDTNVSNVLDVLRWVVAGGVPLELPRVNTPNPNLQKALKIAQGADSLSILRGEKVRAFYRGIANPDDRTPIPVDRHLLTLACGSVTNKNELSRMASDHELWEKVWQAYADIGQREIYGGEPLGNRIASIAWFVQRRRSRNGQVPIFAPSSFICCQRPTHSQGAKRRLCSVCGKSTSKIAPEVRFDKHDATFGRLDSFRISYHHTRRIIHCGKGHPYANQWGWQYFSRYVVMKELGRRIGKDEHVHHVNLDKSCDTLDGSNYRLLLAETHGKYHRYLADLAGYRDDLGRFMEHNEPIILLGEA